MRIMRTFWIWFVRVITTVRHWNSSKSRVWMHEECGKRVGEREHLHIQWLIHRYFAQKFTALTTVYLKCICLLCMTKGLDIAIPTDFYSYLFSKKNPTNYIEFISIERICFFVVFYSFRCQEDGKYTLFFAPLFIDEISIDAYKPPVSIFHDSIFLWI